MPQFNDEDASRTYGDVRTGNENEAKCTDRFQAVVKLITSFMEKTVVRLALLIGAILGHNIDTVLKEMSVEFWTFICCYTLYCLTAVDLEYYYSNTAATRHVHHWIVLKQHFLLAMSFNIWVAIIAMLAIAYYYYPYPGKTGGVSHVSFWCVLVISTASPVAHFILLVCSSSAVLRRGISPRVSDAAVLCAALYPILLLCFMLLV